MNIPKSFLRLLLGKRLPITSGEIQVSGLSDTINIHRDAYGIPYIQAQNERDAYFGLGFCQGQDRAFQLEMLLRITRGTLTELIGEDALSIDRLSRRLGFHRYAQVHFDQMEPKYQSLLEAFTLGINQGVQAGCPKQPHEFAILRSKPTPWTGVDVLAGANFIGFSLSSWSSKLSRLIILKKDGIQALQALDPENADWLPVTHPVTALGGEMIDRMAEDFELLSSAFGLQGASNNWAMNATRTTTGRPLLANDPHLWPGLPAQWYLVHLQAPGLKVAGASFVGAPNIPSGHNQTAAWGVTASMVDSVDLFIERLGSGGNTVQDEESYIPIKTIPETYSIKGKGLFQEDIRITPRGPIITDVMEGDWGETETLSISMRATWMCPQEMAGIIKLHHVKDFKSFREATAEARLISQNIVYADTGDHIGWQYVSDAPKRGKAWGTFPQPGWNPDYLWVADSLTWDEMPHCLDPETGFIATANNKPMVGENGPYLGRDWFEYRQARIVSLLASKDDWDFSSTQRMQVDRVSYPWQEIKQIVVNTQVEGAKAQLAQSELSAWDGVLGQDSLGAAIYEFFTLSMIQRMARAKAPQTVDYALGKGFHQLVLKTFFGIRSTSNLVRKLKSQPDGWFEGGWPTEIEGALSEAVQKLEELLGANPADWSWGGVHQLVLEHPMGGRPPLDRIFNLGPFPTGGDACTIAQAKTSISEFGSKVTGLANLRAVHDVGNWDACRFVIAGGQSGNPFSPHYDDLLEFWLRDEAVNIAWSVEAVHQATRQTLILKPPD